GRPRALVRAAEAPLFLLLRLPIHDPPLDLGLLILFQQFINCGFEVIVRTVL
ncbi:hypothetical protein A2U01_0071053, partial [Trifolium medium]|nr:hypothetical protein [Trifolium medium]